MEAGGGAFGYVGTGAEGQGAELESSTLGGGKECRESIGGGRDVWKPEAPGGGRAEGSGRMAAGGEPGPVGGASGRVWPEARLMAPGTVGKYPPPSETVRSVLAGASGDTPDGTAL